MKYTNVHHIGRRGAFLLFLAMLDLIYAFALAFPTQQATDNSAYSFLALIAPLYFWAILWAVCGLTCLYYAFQIKDAPGFAVAMFIKVVWATLFLLGWMFADVERGYLSSAIWGAFAGLTAVIATWPDMLKGRRE